MSKGLWILSKIFILKKSIFRKGDIFHLNLIDHIITQKAKQEFARSMKFDDETEPHIPPGDVQQPRLLYLHIPFCEKLCPYCSFNRVVFQESVCRDYFKALRKELQLYKTLGYDFSGIYAGGGTPTVLIDELEETLALACRCFNIGEISVETNPNHLTDKNLDILKRAGVKRLSVGIQSFDDGLLKDMERYEKYGSGRDIAGRLKEILGVFNTLNADMIFNFPSQTDEILDQDLEMLLATGVDQITYYPLMVSDSTRQLVSRKLGQVEYGKEKRFYHRICERLIPQYGFSSAWCFSKQTGTAIDEYIVQYDEYAGLGSGSIGFLNGSCYANTFHIPEYIAQLNRGELPLQASRTFGIRDQMRYDFMMHLFGMKLDVAAMRRKYNGVFYRHLWPDVLAFCLAGGLRYEAPYFHLTKRGRYDWIILMREFFTAVNNFRDYCRARIAP
ncbi:MAG: coproporphyrinogen III oxidase family protein [Deltaproteobacteria bacterium]|nr:coproporphyrinogen III oxidase family protein [Deltaproteobacteria bacterium]